MNMSRFNFIFNLLYFLLYFDMDLFMKSFFRYMIIFSEYSAATNGNLNSIYERGPSSPSLVIQSVVEIEILMFIQTYNRYFYQIPYNFIDFNS